PLHQERQRAGAHAALGGPALIHTIQISTENVMNFSFLRPFALAAVLGFAAHGTAGAAQYTSLDAEASQITFGYSQMNVTMDGRFGEMKATELSFDPASPQDAKVVIEVALASVDAGYAEANTELSKDEWLAMS